jgi:hypothetical protein
MEYTREEIYNLLAQLYVEASESMDAHKDCYADQCLADTAGTPDNECGVANA